MVDGDAGGQEIAAESSDIGSKECIEGEKFTVSVKGTNCFWIGLLDPWSPLILLLLRMTTLHPFYSPIYLSRLNKEFLDGRTSLNDDTQIFGKDIGNAY